jgi:hypothetical protein
VLNADLLDSLTVRTVGAGMYFMTIVSMDGSSSDLWFEMRASGSRLVLIVESLVWFPFVSQISIQLALLPAARQVSRILGSIPNDRDFVD